MFLIDQSEPDCARVRFHGTFHGAPVLWDARIVTLQRAQRERSVASVRQFIEVIRVEGRHGVAQVGLPVPRIDRATVLKTITMLRQWRRLDRGLHEFGPDHDYRDSGEAPGP